MTGVQRRLRVEALIAATLAAFALSQFQAAKAAEVVSQNLKAPLASGKILAAIWTRRSDRYTLQIVFPKAADLIVVGENGDLVAPHATRPSVTFWLLGADGTVIPARKEVTPRGPANDRLPIEAAYSVGISAGEQAVAAAIQIDNEYYVEPLQSLVPK